MDSRQDLGTVDKIVEAIGVSALARALGHRNPSTVSSWKQRSSIPVSYWPRVIKAAQDADVEGVTVEALAAACIAQPADLPRPSPATEVA